MPIKPGSRDRAKTPVGIPVPGGGGRCCTRSTRRQAAYNDFPQTRAKRPVVFDERQVPQNRQVTLQAPRGLERGTSGAGEPIDTHIVRAQGLRLIRGSHHEDGFPPVLIEEIHACLPIHLINGWSGQAWREGHAALTNQRGGAGWRISSYLLVTTGHQWEWYWTHIQPRTSQQV